MPWIPGIRIDRPASGAPGWAIDLPATSQRSDSRPTPGQRLRQGMTVSESTLMELLPEITEHAPRGSRLFEARASLRNQTPGRKVRLDLADGTGTLVAERLDSEQFHLQLED